MNLYDRQLSDVDLQFLNLKEIYKNTALILKNGHLNGSTLKTEEFLKSNLYKTLIDKTAFLDEIFDVSISFRLYCVNNNYTDFPICPACNQYIKSFKPGGFNIFCSKICSVSPEADIYRYNLNPLPNQFDDLHDKLNSDYSNIYDVYGHLFLQKNGEFKAAVLTNLYFINSKIYKDIMERTSFLNENRLKFSLRVNCVRDNITEYPKCLDKNCNNIISSYDGNAFAEFCSSKCACSSDIIKERRLKTVKNKYGVENVFQSADIKEKSKETLLTNYGVSHQMYSDEVKEKIKETNLVRYSVENVSQSEEINEKKKQTYRSYRINSVTNTTANIEHCSPAFDIPNEYTFQNNVYAWHCSICNKVYDGLYRSGRVRKCPLCYSFTSQDEIAVRDYINMIYTGKVVNNTYNIIPPKELDIYLPEEKLAIEYNGLYWHSEKQGRDHTYHNDKTQACAEKGIRLIHIFEDEWLHKSDIVKLRLRDILHCADSVDGTKCKIVECRNKNIVKTFFEDNYLGEYADHDHAFSLEYNDKVVAMGSISLYDEGYLMKYCSSCDISGGFLLLVDLFKRYYNKTIIMCCDYRWNVDSTFLNGGFELLETIAPQYWCVNGTKRVETMEEELVLGKVWDCGYSIYFL